MPDSTRLYLYSPQMQPVTVRIYNCQRMLPNSGICIDFYRSHYGMMSEMIIVVG